MPRLAKQVAEKARKAFDTARAAGYSVKEACDIAGVSGRTGRRWATEIPKEAVAPTGTDLGTIFIGREEDLNALSQRFADGRRLVTLLGPPGVGKTRLATEWLKQRAAPLEDAPGIFCDLREVESASDLVAVVANDLGVQLNDATSPAQAIGSVLAARGPLVLVLDNFEQLVDSGAATVGQWLEQAPALRILTTSRRILRLRAEVVFELSPLAIPSDDDDIETAWSVPAVRVLWARAQSTEPQLQLDEATQANLAACAQHLQGLPLALELAAARLASVDTRTLRDQLAKSHLSLASPWRDTDPRHATLERAIEGSWRLLSPSEQAILAQLTVFRGSFTLDAAQAVVRVRGGTPTSIEQGINTLREASLVRVVDARGESRRYQLFEAVREYASLRIRGRAQHDGCERHAEYFLHFGERWTERLPYHEGVVARSHLANDLENLRGAFEWLIECDTDHSHRLRMGVVLHETLVSWLPTGAAEIATRTLRAVGTHAAAHQTLVIGLRIRLGASLRMTGRCDEAEQSLRSARSDIERFAGQNHGEACALRAAHSLELGRLRHLQSRMREARQLFTRCVKQAKECGQRSTEAWAHRELSEVLAEAFADRAAFEHYRRAIEGFRELGDTAGEMEARYGFALDRWFLEDEDPKTEFEQQLESAECDDDRSAIAHLTFGLGIRALLLDDADRARALLESASSRAEQAGLQLLRAGTLLARGLAFDLIGDGSCATSLIAEAIDAYASMQNRRHEALAHLFRSGALARAARLHEAEDEMDRAASLLDAREDIRFPHLIDLHIANIEVERAGICFQSGEPEKGNRLLDSVRTREKNAETEPVSAEVVVPIIHCCKEAVLCLRLLRSRRQEIEGLRSQVRFDAEGAWFETGSTPRTTIHGSPVLQKLLHALIAQRLTAPGSSVSADKLVSLCWPGERMSHASGLRRVRNLVYRLRSAGLEGTLVTGSEGGYLLNPDVPISVESEPS